MKNVWKTDKKDCESLYKKFVLQKAKSFNLEINPNWFNIMDFKIHNSHLSLIEYKEKESNWKNFLKEWTFDKFLEEKIKATKQEFKNSYM